MDLASSLAAHPLTPTPVLYTTPSWLFFVTCPCPWLIIPHQLAPMLLDFPPCFSSLSTPSLSFILWPQLLANWYLPIIPWNSLPAPQYWHMPGSIVPILLTSLNHFLPCTIIGGFLPALPFPHCHLPCLTPLTIFDIAKTLKHWTWFLLVTIGIIQALP